jgi:hypothetical protein
VFLLDVDAPSQWRAVLIGLNVPASWYPNSDMVLYVPGPGVTNSEVN